MQIKVLSNEQLKKIEEMKNKRNNKLILMVIFSSIFMLIYGAFIYYILGFYGVISLSIIILVVSLIYYFSYVRKQKINFVENYVVDSISNDRNIENTNKNERRYC